jgi:hypothetical protein
MRMPPASAMAAIRSAISGWIQRGPTWMSESCTSVRPMSDDGRRRREIRIG